MSSQTVTLSSHVSRRYQPKYKANVVQFNAMVTLQRLFAYFSRPHPGSLPDTTIARSYRPTFQPSETVLGDKAYISVPNCLVPIKERPGGLTLPEPSTIGSYNFTAPAWSMLLAG